MTIWKMFGRGLGEGEKSGERVGRGWESEEMEGTRWGEWGEGVDKGGPQYSLKV